MSATPIERWERVLPALPYLFLLLPATFALIDEWRPVILLLTMAGVAWTAALYRRSETNTAIALLYLAGTLGLLAALVHQDPLFSVTGVGLFVQVFTLLPGWQAYVGVAATSAVLVLARPRGDDGLRELLASFLVALLIASATGMLFNAISRQSEERRQLIDRLQELAEENAVLQSQLLSSAREAGVLAERQRMAREIHDTIAQGLTGILTQVEAAADEGGSTGRLDTIRGLARDSLNEARRSIHALRPAELQQGDLTAALQRVVDGTGVPAALSITGDPRALHPEVEHTLLRVAQEALTNIAKHANATRVGVTLSYMEDVVALDIRDDGDGFTSTSTTSGFGLIGMRQRVTRLAGSFEVESTPGEGTGISATVPAIPAPED
ncbi:sensor histidine kinase [Kribbella sp. NPDC050124]|uniref:sensor histidine kinase n=1 Tax=Kribbella sp. NPDC050124 TaxID=3364114 RepID=UPI003793CB67